MKSHIVRPQRVLMSVSDKNGIVELAQALVKVGSEIVATGKTAKVLEDAQIQVTPIEKLTGMPEAFQGRMKTLSFQVCSGILYRRGDASDEKDLKSLAISAIDAVVVNFYPFESASKDAGAPPLPLDFEAWNKRRDQLVEQIDIGGPTLVRSAAKNSKSVLVATNPKSYGKIILDLEKNNGFSESLLRDSAEEAWDHVLSYDQAIADEFGTHRRMVLRYGENPHQWGEAVFDSDGPVDWSGLTSNELSYNNILDFSSAYALTSDLLELFPNYTSVVIVKHNNPCGVACVPRSVPDAQMKALELAWAGDPVSAFGGVLSFSDPLTGEVQNVLKDRFVELIGAPDLKDVSSILEKRKKLKAVHVRSFGQVPSVSVASIPGGRLIQKTDRGFADEKWETVTQKEIPSTKKSLSRFGVAITRALKSNALSIVRELPDLSLQLIGAGQGQPNRVEALNRLAVPRARTIEDPLDNTILVSDAFFPFRDTVDFAAQAGIRFIVQPGGSIKDKESIDACNEHGMAMVFTGVRHFRH